MLWILWKYTVSYRRTKGTYQLKYLTFSCKIILSRMKVYVFVMNIFSLKKKVDGVSGLCNILYIYEESNIFFIQLLYRILRNKTRVQCFQMNERHIEITGKKKWEKRRKKRPFIDTKFLISRNVKLFILNTQMVCTYSGPPILWSTLVVHWRRWNTSAEVLELTHWWSIFTPATFQWSAIDSKAS